MERTRLNVTIIEEPSAVDYSTVAAQFTVQYAFEDMTIVVEDIPGRWDRANERERVSGPVAATVNRLVMNIREARARLWEQEGTRSVLATALVVGASVRVRAADFLPAA